MSCEPDLATWESDIAPIVERHCGTCHGESPNFGAPNALVDHAMLLAGEEGAKSPQEAYYFYWGAKLHAVRKGKWSLHLPHSYRSLKGKPGSGGIQGPYVQRKTDLALFDLEADIGQKNDLAKAKPAVVAELQALAEAHEKYVEANRRHPQQH